MIVNRIGDDVPLPINHNRKIRGLKWDKAKLVQDLFSSFIFSKLSNQQNKYRAKAGYWATGSRGAKFDLYRGACLALIMRYPIFLFTVKKEKIEERRETKDAT